MHIFFILQLRGAPSLRKIVGKSLYFSLFNYASAFRRRRHYVFGLSVRPSVRSPKYPLSNCTWVRWSIRPTVTILRHLRLSGEVSGICRRTHWGNCVKFCMLMYRNHLQNWLGYGHGLFIFLLLAPLWLSETGQIYGLLVFPGERMEGIASNLAY